MPPSSATSPTIRDDEEALDDAARIQQATLGALRRIQATNVETQESGANSLAGLRQQREQFERVFVAADRVDTGLHKTEQLQNKLSLWSLRFNKRSAKREVDQQRTDARKLAQQHAKVAEKRLKEKRQEEDWSIGDESSSNASSSAVSTKKKVVVPKKGKKSNNASDGAWSKRKDLLYGVDTTKIVNDQHREKLEQLNETDREIDTALDVVANQVETILSMGKEMRSELNNQSGSMDVLETRLEKTKYKQDVINKRTTKFLDGNVRKRHDLVDTFGAGPLSRIASPTSVVKAKGFLEI